MRRGGCGEKEAGLWVLFVLLHCENTDCLLSHQLPRLAPFTAGYTGIPLTRNLLEEEQVVQRDPQPLPRDPGPLAMPLPPRALPAFPEPPAVAWAVRRG